MTQDESSIIIPITAAESPSFVAYTQFPQVEQWLEAQLRKIPLKFPDRWRTPFVRAVPWASLSVLPLQVFATLGLFGITILEALFGSFEVLRLVLGVAALICEMVALPGLFKRNRTGWAFSLYATLLVALDSVLSLSPVGFVLSVFILWLAMAVKSEYRD